MEFTLRFPLSDIHQWCKHYTYPQGDAESIRIGELARKQGYLTREQFLAIAKWKSARPGRHHAANDAATIEEVTRFAFSTTVEDLRLRALTLLRGVQPRTASAILHLCHRDAYPMMDIRALWSLGIDQEPADWCAIWPEYTRVCRTLAHEASIDLRTLDRALWVYSNAHKSVAR